MSAAAPSLLLLPRGRLGRRLSFLAAGISDWPAICRREIHVGADFTDLG